MKTKTMPGFKQSEIGSVPENWEVKPVKHFCLEITSGGTPSRNKIENWDGGKIPWLKTQELNDGNIYNTDERITEQGLNSSSAKLLPIDTVLMAMYGATVGKLGILKIQATTNQAFCAMVVNHKIADHRFLFYSLLQNRDKLMNLASGAAQQNLNLYIINEFLLPFPKLSEQKAIAKIPSDIDTKIEHNKKMNKTLETIAQAIFKHWFIDFDFPNEEGKPYKSSGGQMVDSELGEIPKGWNIRKLGDLGKIVCGKTPSTKDDTNFGQDVPFITIPDMRGNVFTLKTERYLSTRGANSQETKFLPPLSVCVSCIATPGLVTLTSTTSQTNQQINSIICKEGVNPFFVYFVSKEKSQEIINMGLGGTATLNLNTSEFSNLKVILPDTVALKKFHDFTTQFFKKILNNSKEILVLTDIRDSIPFCIF